MDIQISVIIVNFNTSDLLNDCLKSLKNDPDTPSYEIIVTDNNSCDNSISMLKSQHPDVIRIENDRNAGFAAANNQALAAARGAYVWLLNPDTLVFPGCMQRLLRFMEKTPDAGAVGPRTWLDPSKSLEVCSLKLLTPDRAKAAFTRLPYAERQSILLDIWERDARLWEATAPLAVEGIGGAALFIKKDRLDRLGGLDTQFFMGYEDTDLCTALHRARKQIFILPDAEIVHLFGQAKQRPEAPLETTYSWQAAPRAYLRKYYGPAAAQRFTRQRRWDRIWRRLTPAPNPGMTGIHESGGVRLAWPGSSTGDFCLEISNEPIFYDKFGKRVIGNAYLIPRDVLDRLKGRRWYWRVWDTVGGRPETPAAGCFWTWS